MNSDPAISKAETSPNADEVRKNLALQKARLLLDREPLDEVRSEWTRFYATEKKVVPPTQYSLVIFRLGDEWFGLATKVFQEITERTPIHTLPHRNNNIVLGLVRIRGELLICVSLATVLGINARPPSEAENRKIRYIVLNNAGRRFVFPADEVHGVHRVCHDLAPIPSTVAHSAVTYTRGVFSWENRTVGCLDDQLLFYTLNRSFA